MKKLVAIMSLLSFIAVLSLSSALSQEELTGCFRDDKKNSKINRVSSGSDPGKACKNKETEVSWPTSAAVEAEAQILQDQIDEIKTELISSLIGGAHNRGSNSQRCEQDGSFTNVCISPLTAGDPPTCAETVSIPNTQCTSGPIAVTQPTTAFMGMYVTRGVIGSAANVEFRVQQKLQATGVITHMAVNVDQGPGLSDFSRYTLRINEAPAKLFPGSNVDFFCDIDNTDQPAMCDVTSESIPPCVQVSKGDRISIGMLFSPVNDSQEALVFPARWNARFVEGGVCEEIISPE